MSASKSIPVDIFANKELGIRYCIWQLSQPGPQEVGMISSAAEFRAFCKHDNVLDFGRNFDETGRRIGSKCGHLLHPSSEEDVEYCPVCEAVAHLDLLDLIAEAWDVEGSPWSKHCTEKYYILVSAWHKTRLELEDLVTTFEEEAVDQARWENEYPEQADAARKTLSAAKAVIIARAMSRYPGAVAQREVIKIPGKEPVTPSDTPSMRQKRKVMFAPDTNFERGRSQGQYRRGIPRYEPGEHAADPFQQLIDTSNLNNSLYNVSQLKVLTNPRVPVARSLSDDIAPSEHEGIAELHPRWSKIRQYLLKRAQHKDLAFRKEFLGNLKEADFLLLKVKAGKLTKAVPWATQDIEDVDEVEPETDNRSDTEAPGRRWTAYLDVLPKGYLDDIKSAYGEPDHLDTIVPEGLASEAVLERQPQTGSKKRPADEEFEESAAKRAM